MINEDCKMTDVTLKWSSVDSEKELKLGKRLAYLLRYGAEKEGLHLLEGGWVDVMELSKVPLLKNHTVVEILHVIHHSTSNRGTRRFEKRYFNNTLFVRALYCRNFERNPNHIGSSVLRLLEICLSYICNNITLYDFEGFPDEFLINALIHKLKRQKKLSNKVLPYILSPTVEHLDFSGVYLTENTLKILTRRSPHLKVLNLHDAGYLMTDHYMEILCKGLPELESLNISSCRHLTDRAANAICKKMPKLIHLNASNVINFSEAAILNLVIECVNLNHIDIFYNTNLSSQGMNTLVEIAKERRITIALKHLKDVEVVLKNPSSALEIWRNIPK